MNEKSCMSIRISLKFVSKSPIDNISALVPVMAWRRTGDKPLPEPMLTQFTDAYIGSDGKNSFIVKINGTSTAWKKLTRFDTHHCNSYWNISLYIEILYFINGLVQDWSISIANALEILKSCFKQSIYSQYIAVSLTHCGLGTPHGDIDLGQHWPR